MLWSWLRNQGDVVCVCAHLFTLHLACIIDIHVYLQLSTYIQILRARIANSPSRIRGTRKDGLWHRALGLLSILASKTLAPVVTTLNAVPCWHQGHRLAPVRILIPMVVRKVTSNSGIWEEMHSWCGSEQQGFMKSYKRSFYIKDLLETWENFYIVSNGQCFF